MSTAMKSAKLFLIIIVAILSANTWAAGGSAEDNKERLPGGPSSTCSRCDLDPAEYPRRVVPEPKGPPSKPEKPTKLDGGGGTNPPKAR